MFNISPRKKLFTVSVFIILIIILFFFINKNNVDLQVANQPKEEKNNSQHSSQNSLLKKNKIVKNQIITEKKLDNNLKEPKSTDKKPNDYIVDCQEFFNRFSSLYSKKLDRRRSIENLVKKLSNSQSQSVQLATLIADISDKEKRTANLERARLLKPENKVVNWKILLNCTNNQKCDENKLTEALEKDYNNSAIWLNIAIIKINDGDMEGAFNALQKSTNASGYNDYEGEQIEIFYQASQESSNNQATSMMNFFALHDHMNPLDYMKIIDFCQNNIHSNTNILSICSQVAYKMRHQGNSIFSNVAGNRMLRNIYEVTNDKESLAEEKRFRKNFDAWSQSEQRMKTIALFVYDSEFHRYYLDHKKELGEWKAFELATEEAIRLSKDEDYNPCKGSLLNDDMIVLEYSLGKSE